MKRIISVFIGIALLLSLAACSSQSGQSDKWEKSISANKLTQQEKIAIDFTQNLYSGNKSKQIATINQYAAPKTISSLKDKIKVGGFQQTFHSVEVIKGAQAKLKGREYFLALLEMKDSKSVVNKRIVIMPGDKVLHILSGNVQTYKKELGS
ncbi:hypothetical protein [Sporolactobacillus pectinivorans]|uniref:hypothetical protein n=1 Tax=Sporolactobacillus pectinivorans TaxID=1591408 RepID=UPI000C2569D7|nr:hypothetical protein [Sporolactobacillus pectinivorans]